VAILLEDAHVAVHLLERLLQRADVALELGLGEREERGVVLLQRIRRERPDGVLEALVGRAALDVELGERRRQLLLAEPQRAGRVAALRQPSAHCEPDACGAGEKTDEHRDDRHEGQPA
jgi:hypothetical protein